MLKRAIVSTTFAIALLSLVACGGSGGADGNGQGNNTPPNLDDLDPNQFQFRNDATNFGAIAAFVFLNNGAIVPITNQTPLNGSLIPGGTSFPYDIAPGRYQVSITRTDYSEPQSQILVVQSGDKGFFTITDNGTGGIDVQLTQ